ncbi:MAG: adenylate/guanylate cyclase domain-containing protein [Spartobacteria bacterium]
MPDEEKTKLRLEIAHILFIDIVGYSKLLADEQHEQIQRLNEIVRATEQFRAAELKGELIRLPTGDGMALVFRTDPEAPMQCAVEIAKALKTTPKLSLRMGIHSGPVNQVSDVNERSNVAGAGMNLAQRVMDCGDAGHILLSKRSADDLSHYRQWQPLLHDLGECDVKHGLKLDLVNFYTDEVGNSAVPEKLRRSSRSTGIITTARRGRRLGFGAAIVAVTALATVFLRTHRVSGPAPSASLAAISGKSIAVLPFENMSDDKQDAFFADGIQDDVLTSLGKIKELTVIGRNSVMSYRGAAVGGKLREIGKILGVAHVLQGSVRRAANRVVVNVQLIDTRDEHQLWTERYERTMNDSLSLQGELAIEIARELRATLSPAEKSIVATKPTENAEAYLLYLRARELELRFGAEQEPDAAAINPINLYREAIERDPKFALARARLSFGLSLSDNDSFAGDADCKEALTQAKESLRLNPNLGEARIALAAYRFWCQRDPEPALAELVRAEELLPNSSEVWSMRAMIYKRQNKFRERIAALQHGETLDPRDATSVGLLTITFWAVRQWPEMIRTLDRWKAVSPGEYQLAWWQSWGEFHLTGMLEPLKKMVTHAPAETPPEALNMWRYRLAMLERDYPTADRVLHDIPAATFRPWESEASSKLANEALLAVARGADPTTAESALVAARAEMEKELAEHPADATCYWKLGLIDAFRGRKEEAIREGRRGVELATNSILETNDASAALALIYARTGEPDNAIKLIEELLILPANLTNGWFFAMTQADLKWSWVWDPLRSDPRFQKILAGTEPKTIY